jgi:hypothetical protein
VIDIGESIIGDLMPDEAAKVNKTELELVWKIYYN